METRNDGSKGKTAAEMIAEDATRSHKANSDLNGTDADYEDNLDADAIETLDDDFLANDGLTKDDGESERRTRLDPP
jgi:hypothetical protein